MSLRIAYCVFPSSLKEYAYLCPFEDAAVGDHATVQTGTVRIMRLSRHLDGTRATRSLICINRPDPAIRKREIEKRLAELQRDYELAAKYIALAKKSPEAKRLIAEYKRLK